MKVGKFQNADDVAMSEKLIRAEFPYGEGYRFFPARYRHEPEFSTNFMWPVRVYVLSGSCGFSRKSGAAVNEHVEVVEGFFVDLDPGRYYLQVGESGVMIINMYHIPDLIDRQSSQ